MDAVLEALNLGKTFKNRAGSEIRAVRDVSFELYPGETLGIVGSSGCGKSTLARMLCRLIEPTEGKIILSGSDFSSLRGRELREKYRDIQLVFQDPVSSFDPRRTLGDGIGEGLRSLGMTREETSAEVRRLLSRCGLDESMAKRYPHEVSGGQCQRAAIARAIALRPKVLICDEATSALDVTVQQRIMELLGSLRGENGLAIIFICHNLALAQSFCDELLVMNVGSVVERGTPDDIIMHPKTEYTKMLIEAAI